MSLRGIHSVVITGNTFANKDTIKALGAQFVVSEKHWVIVIHKHPMNTIKLRPELEKRIAALGKVGCLLEYRTNASVHSPKDS